ncbi:MAG TPA: hypothetical protein VIC34_03265 [Croceibacterium sp.]|jgi:uncharacterized membrane protein YhaH (DUF805 family)
MNFEALYVNPADGTAKPQYIPALIVLLAVVTFYYFLVPGRTGQFALLMLLYPGLALHARRLHGMGKPGWLALVPGLAIAATAWLHLYPAFSANVVSFVTGAAIGLSAVFIVWALLGKDAAPA